MQSSCRVSCRAAGWRLQKNRFWWPVSQRKVPYLDALRKLFMNLVQHKHFHSKMTAWFLCFEAKSNIHACYLNQNPPIVAPFTLSLPQSGLRIRLNNSDSEARWGGDSSLGQGHLSRELSHMGRFNQTYRLSTHTLLWSHQHQYHNLTNCSRRHIARRLLACNGCDLR